MPVEGEYMQRHDSGVELRRERLKWEDPGMIELSRARRRARGNCESGSGDSFCLPGYSATGNCGTLGNSAGVVCYTGNSASTCCDSGTEGIACP